MNVQLLTDHLSTLTPLSKDFREALEAILVIEHYQPHQIIHAVGQTETRAWFVASGFLRSYYFDDAGKEHTEAFYGDRDLIFSYKGLTQQPADQYIEALHDTTLISLNYSQIALLQMEYREMSVLAVLLLQELNRREQFRTRLLMQSAEDRYRQFRKAYPSVFQRAPVRMIAAYLNMTRENLSRLISRNP
jgi:CRP-like cAMP-binding protein